MIAAAPVKYRLFYAFWLVLLLIGLQPLHAQTEAQANEDILLLQNQTKPDRYVEIRSGDKVVYPVETERGPRKQRVRIAAIEDSSLIVQETKYAPTYSIQLTDYPYLKVQRRGVRRAFRTLGLIGLGIGAAGGILSLLILAFSTSSGASLGAAIVMIFASVIAIPFVAISLILFLFIWRKIWLKNWKIRKTSRRNVVKKVVPAEK